MVSQRVPSVVAQVVCKGCLVLRKSDFDSCFGGLQRVFGLAKERLNKGCFSGLQGSGVRDLAKK
jgi:hypothetical protein